MAEQRNESLLKSLKDRRSVRKYQDKKIDDSVIEEIIGLAAYAPSWKNSQSVRYIVIENKDMINDIAQNCVMDFEYNKKTILNSPALILVTTVASRSGYERDGSFSTSKETHWESFDAGIATQTLALAAYEYGLGTVIMGIYDEDKVIKAASIPEGQKVSAMMAIGYPDEEPKMPKRKDTEALLSFRK